MRRKVVVPVFLLMLLVALPACADDPGSEEPAGAGPPTAEAEPEAQDDGGNTELQKVNLLIDFFANGNHALFYVAQQEGYFAEEGLDVTIEHIRGSIEVVNAIVAGRTEFGYASLASMAVARAEHGEDLLAVMGIQQQTPVAIMSPVDRGIREPKDIEGRTIVNFAGSASETEWPVFLAENAVDESAVDYQLVEPGGMISLIVAGQADGMILFFTDNEPRLRTACECEVNTMAWKDWGIKTLANGLIVPQSLATESPDLVARFVRAVQRGLAFAGENPEAAAQALLAAQSDAGDPDLIAETVSNSFSLSRTEHNEDLPLGAMALEDWEATIELLVQTGQLAERPVDIEAFFTNEFVPN